jgi:hypothetical protein
MRTYVVGKKENKREGQAKMVVDAVKKHGPISTADILKRLKSQNPDCLRWHISQLAKAKCIVAYKAPKKQGKSQPHGPLLVPSCPVVLHGQNAIVHEARTERDERSSAEVLARRWI